jgi:hypothetical protein
MADGDFQPSSNPRGGRGPRDGAGREPGGFRIRLSDNEMRAARAVQEAFGLRSTVAALGLSIRTVAQLLDEGKLDEVLAQHRANGGSRPSGGGERRGPRPERDERPSNRPNPFARPARPVTTPPEVSVEEETAASEAAPLTEEISAEESATAVDPATSEA